jgi:hypothetical protein
VGGPFNGPSSGAVLAGGGQYMMTQQVHQRDLVWNAVYICVVMNQC